MKAFRRLTSFDKGRFQISFPPFWLKINFQITFSKVFLVSIQRYFTLVKWRKYRNTIKFDEKNELSTEIKEEAQD